MKIVVLNGSPKGDLSITLQSVLFIQKKFPEHEFKIFNVAEKIKNIEEDDRLFQSIIDEINTSDGVLWAFPVYIFLVPSQYKRFIEFIWEKGNENIFKNKYTAALTTSIHFFDNTAHNYMNAICDDLEMKYVGSFSADMYDLLIKKERERLLIFAEIFFETINKEYTTSRRYPPLYFKSIKYSPTDSRPTMVAGRKKIIVLTDCSDENTNLGKMIKKFKNSISEKVETINLYNLDIKGGCLGCLQCTLDNICVYNAKDKFTEFYNTKLKAADILIFAGSIKDRYLSSRWKLFFDRTFFNTHIPTLIGKQIGFIISGPFSQLPNLREIFEAHIALHQSNLTDFVTDEPENSSEIDMSLQNLARQTIAFSDKRYVKTPTFLNIAGMKIFRDYVWGKLRFLLQADHEYYKNHGFYDFPQKDVKSRVTNMLIIALTKIPSVRKIFAKKLKLEMVKPHKQILKNI